MTIDHRILDEWRREFILAYRCGCAYLWRTGEQVAFCPTCPVQLRLPL